MAGVNAALAVREHRRALLLLRVLALLALDQRLEALCDLDEIGDREAARQDRGKDQEASDEVAPRVAIGQRALGVHLRRVVLVALHPRAHQEYAESAVVADRQPVLDRRVDRVAKANVAEKREDDAHDDH